MQIILTAKGIDLTDAIKDYVDKKIGALEKFYDQIIRAHVVVGVESHHHLKGDIFMAECKLEVPGNDLFASKNEKNLYKAIDQVRDFLEGELKKHKVILREKVKQAKRQVRATKEYNPES
ncbi:MAG: ribosome-associated translation inhibitor RaiA [bacterium]|nr:ribosome-associated translation inhibitor RaiA [bacterium]